jgi:hypothetical protein
MGLFRRKLKEGRDFITLSEEEYVERMKAARESFTRVEWKPIRREYIGMIYAALKAMPRGFGRYQNDNDIDEAIALADELIEKIKENEKITGYE